MKAELNKLLNEALERKENSFGELELEYCYGVIDTLKKAIKLAGDEK